MYKMICKVNFQGSSWNGVLFYVRVKVYISFILQLFDNCVWGVRSSKYSISIMFKITQTHLIYYLVHIRFYSIEQLFFHPSIKLSKHTFKRTDRPYHRLFMVNFKVPICKSKRYCVFPPFLLNIYPAFNQAKDVFPNTRISFITWLAATKQSPYPCTQVFERVFLLQMAHT